MSGMKKLVFASLALLAVPFSAKAEVVIGVGIPGPFYRSYYHGRHYRPYVVVAPPVVYAPGPGVVYAAPPPGTVYAAPPPGTVYAAPPPGTVYYQPAAPAPAPIYVPR